MDVLLHLAAAFVVIAVMLPWIRRDDWWIRVFDFPRLQLFALGVLTLVGYRFVDATPIAVAMQLAAGAATLLQLWGIIPYTRLAPRQVEDATAEETGYSNLRLIVCNVFMPNRRAADLLRLVERERPDLLLVVETDAWWDEQLQPLAKDYPYAVRQPQPNTYGMLLYSRHPLLRPQVRFLVEDDVPSIVTAVDLPRCPTLRLFCLHPRPPRPDKAQDSTNRDAELMLIGHQVRGSGDPIIVAGDLNDVAWSYTTELFLRVSGLLDPRRGRGMYNTFNARNPLLRFPLDHVFHSTHFRLVRLQRLPNIGSDHFPILVELSYEEHAVHTQAAPQADGDDLAMSRVLQERPKRKGEESGAKE